MSKPLTKSLKPKERPVLFSGPMVRALLSGAKTQTRRLFKLPSGMEWYDDLGGEPEGWFTDGVGWWSVDELACPFGAVGDRLWVRETFMVGADEIAFRSTDQPLVGCDRWRPSIHMNRVYSRIDLQITGTRVERLLDISDADCRAEGCCERGWNVTDWKHGHSEFGWSIERSNFASLWSSLNGPESWAANPWVWVVEFERVTS